MTTLKSVLVDQYKLVDAGCDGLYRRPLGFGDFSAISKHLKSVEDDPASLSEDVEVMRKVALELFRNGVICDKDGVAFKDVKESEDLDVIPAKVLISVVSSVVEEISLDDSKKK